MRATALALLLAASTLQASPTARVPSQVSTQCAAAPFDRTRLRTLAATQFRNLESAERHALALALLPCLASPDAELRDELAFRAYARLMRRDELAAETLRRLDTELRAGLFPNDGRDDGFRHAFSVLVLADVAGADARKPFLDAAGRTQLLQAAMRYLRELRDWRGFDPAHGWRHGVAHAADLIEQLALHPAIERDDSQALLDALTHQIAPAAEHFYVFGEPERLAAAAAAVAQRGLLDDTAWNAWLDRVVSPAPLPNWNAAYASLAGLARRHNTIAFLSALELQLRADDSRRAQALADAMSRRRRALP